MADERIRGICCFDVAEALRQMTPEDLAIVFAESGVLPTNPLAKSERRLWVPVNSGGYPHACWASYLRKDAVRQLEDAVMVTWDELREGGWTVQKMDLAPGWAP